MSESAVAIVGAGIAGIALADMFTRAGHNVVIFEKGVEYPYPHFEQFQEEYVHFQDNPAYDAHPSIKNHTISGVYYQSLERERAMRVGGSATHWEGISLRMTPEDFRTRTLFGYGKDWPITYADLEPFYGEAERLLGVSGTDTDNPFAPPRSRPYPLPPFELSHDDRLLQDRLAQAGLVLHTTPQARARLPYDGRPACQNYGTCRVCPIGARYSPNHLLNKILASGLCSVRANTSIRRIVTDETGAARSLVCQDSASSAMQEHAARVIVVAAGALESARLLLLSKDDRHPNGLGNGAGHVGRNLTFHSLWGLRLRYANPLYPGRFGGWTGQSHQFINAPTRGQHASVKADFSSHAVLPILDGLRPARTVADTLRESLYWRPFVIHAESVADEKRSVALSQRRDRFGDPFAHINYGLAEIDHATYEFGKTLAQQFVQATGATELHVPPVEHYGSGGHHMGTCRMSARPADGVVDPFGRLHGFKNLFAAGASVFVGSSGAMNPTLTLLALTLRTGRYILDQVL